MTEPEQSPQSGPPSSPYQVPVGRVLSYAFSTTFGNPVPLLLSIAAPFLLGLLAFGALMLLFQVPLLNFAIPLAILLYAYGVFAVNWHRFVLLNQSPPFIPRDQKRIWTFAGMGAGLGLILLVAATLLITLVTLIVFGITGLPSEEALANPPPWFFFVNLGAALLIQYPMARLFLIFPAIAMGRPWSLDQAVKASQGNGFRIVFAAFFIPTLIQQFSFLGVDQVLDPESVGSIVCKLLIAIPIAAVGIAALSICYRGLVLHREQQDNT